MHTPTCINNLYTCPACAFRAVATSVGLFVTEAGDDKAAHLAAIQEQHNEARAEAARIMDRLRELYGSHAVFEGKALSLNQLQRLCRAVVAEFAE